jgi:uncharacterized protein (DUF1499 family)
MPTHRITTHSILLLSALLLAACSGTRPGNLGVMNGKLAQCPASPNCVSSDGIDEVHYVAPLIIATTPDAAWDGVKQYLLSQPNFIITTETNHYFHIECASALLGFVDDFEIYLLPQNRKISVRSASRLGYSDFGVNRDRITHFRNYLRANKLINMD